MADEIKANCNLLIVWLLQLNLAESKPANIKNYYPVCDSNGHCEKAVIDYVNGDQITFVVSDEGNVQVTFVPNAPNQAKIRPDNPMIGKCTYPIDTWPGIGSGSKIAAYIARLHHIMKDVLTKHDDGTLDVMCALSNGIGPHGDDPGLDWCKDATFELK